MLLLVSKGESMPNTGKLEQAIREFIIETVAEQFVGQNEEDEEDRRSSGTAHRGQVVDPEHDRRLKENRGKDVA